jgi:ABC-type multidrug transport system ATPase subunit
VRPAAAAALQLTQDEPTSGLDSVTALSMCKLLRRLATSRTVTVVCTIHQ